MRAAEAQSTSSPAGSQSKGSRKLIGPAVRVSEFVSSPTRRPGVSSGVAQCAAATTATAAAATEPSSTAALRVSATRKSSPS